MILYFSGTGNSAFVARRLASLLNDEAPVALADADASSIDFSGPSLGLVFPIYSWGPAPAVLDFIARIPDSVCSALKEKRIWAVATCGDETGNAPVLLRRALAARGLTIDAFMSVIMPNTYVLLPGFDVDSPQVEASKLAAAEGRIKDLASRIARGVYEDDYAIGSWPRLKTSIFPLFRRWGIFPRRWRSESNCIGCGKCAKACPVSNIVIKDGRPVWSDNCLSCLGCYHHCPVHAVEYGQITAKKGQYFCKPE